MLWLHDLSWIYDTDHLQYIQRFFKHCLPGVIEDKMVRDILWN